MKKNSKGFTLIELLAVIVILAIIALIATPVILNIIKKARISATQDSAYSLRKQAQLYYSLGLIDDGTFEAAAFKCDKDNTDGKGRYCKKVAAEAMVKEDGTAMTAKEILDATDVTYVEDTVPNDIAYLELDGTNPSAGVVTISATGDIAFEGIKYGDFSCTIPVNGKVTCQ